MGVLLYPPIKERLLLDRTLVIIGLTFTSIITVLLGLAPKEPTPEVAKITFIDVTPFLILPPSTTSTTSTLPEVIPAGVPTDHTKRCPKWEAKFREYGLPVQAFHTSPTEKVAVILRHGTATRMPTAHKTSDLFRSTPVGRQSLTTSVALVLKDYLMLTATCQWLNTFMTMVD